MTEMEVKCIQKMRELILLENADEAERRLIPGSRKDEAIFVQTRTATHFLNKPLSLK